jgi:transmembrane sensor
MNKYEHIDELIAKHLAGETTSGEEDIVQSWIANSETNKIYYSEMQLVYEVAEEETIHNKIKLDAAWKKFSKKITEPIAEEPILKKLTAAFYGKAALFIGMFGLAYLAYNHLNQMERPIVFSSSVSSTRSNTLPDGTFVVLNPKSNITYSSSFNDTNRELKLMGEASFHVHHQADLPFIVNIGNAFVKDIGTSFIIKATPSDSIVMVYVEEGEVIFYSVKNSGIALIKNETGIYNLISGTFRKKEDGAIEALSETSQTLSFENTSLRFVIDTLNKVYNEHITLSCEKLESLELTATFKEKTVAPIIETITETFGLSVNKANGTISLNSKDCK